MRITGTLYALILHKPIDSWILSLLLLTLDDTNVFEESCLNLALLPHDCMLWE